MLTRQTRIQPLYFTRTIPKNVYTLYLVTQIAALTRVLYTREQVCLGLVRTEVCGGRPNPGSPPRVWEVANAPGQTLETFVNSPAPIFAADMEIR